MNSKTVIGLGTAAVLALVAAVAITSARKPVVEPSAKAAYLFPDLRDHINEAKSLTIAGAGNTPLVTVEKTAQGWTLKEKGGYPANLGEVRALLLKLADARLLEKKTTNETRYAELGVEDTGKPDAQGVLLTLDGLTQPVQVIIGKTNSRGDGAFIRRPGEQQSWLIEGHLTVAKDPGSWLETSVADIAPARIKEVALRRPDGKVLHIFKQPGDANFKVADVPKGRELSSDFAANSLGSVLSGLRLEDVKPAGQAEPPADGKSYHGRFTTFEGLVIDVTAWKKDDKNFARLDAALNAALAEAHIRSEQARAKTEYEAKQPKDTAKEAAKPAEPPPLAVSDPVKDREQRLVAVDAELTKMKQRFSGWTFLLPAYSFGNLDKSLEDLLKPVEPGKPGTKGGRPLGKDTDKHAR